MKPRTLPCLAVLALAAFPSGARAHHPVGIPQYRQDGGSIVMIYNVLTQDYVVRLQARPGRPSCPPPAPVALRAEIAPRDPAVVFPGGTYVSISEDLGGGAEREVLPAERKSEEAGPRAVEAAFTFDHPGGYIVRVEFQESPGREVLSFPLLVTRSGRGAGAWLLRAGLPALLVAAALLLARAAAARRRKRAAAGPERAR